MLVELLFVPFVDSRWLVVLFASAGASIVTLFARVTPSLWGPPSLCLSSSFAAFHTSSHPKEFAAVV